MLDVPISRSTRLPQGLTSFGRAYTKSYWMKLFLSPLPVCLLLTVLIRIWLTIHTQGVIAGDEGIVGIQAEHILRGEHPIYYYAQPYMGSFEAYFMAFIFLFTGPSVWALRAEPMFIALVLVYLTWRFANALADGARLTSYAKTLFVTIATLGAAFPPLYDIVEEMRARGGYAEACTVMLWLLYCAWSLTYRWRKNASRRELLLRWAGLGFLIGLGVWIDPLVAYALLAIALWLGYFFVVEFIKPQRQNRAQPRLTLLKEALLALVAIPAGLLGFAPGLYWGAHNHWQNITYMLNNGGSTTQQDRLHTIMQVQSLYTSCLAPRAIGGIVPTQPYVTTENPHIMTLGVVIGATCLFLCSIVTLLSFVWPQTLLKNIRQLTILPLLFFLCASLIFCTASIAVVSLASGCGPWDAAGRYVMPLVIAVPFFVAAVFTIPLLLKRRLPEGQEEEKQPERVRGTGVAWWWIAIQIVLLFVLAVNFLVRAVEYKHADPGYTFQATGPVVAYPANNDPLIAYMQKENIHYGWGTGWIADPITFKTDESIIISEPHGRVEANDQAVFQAKRTALLLIVLHSDAHPFILSALDARHVRYKVGRFYSEPGIDALVIIPQNRTLSPLDPDFADVFNAIFSNYL